VNWINKRLAKLEESHPDEDGGIVAVTTEADAASLIAAYRQAGKHPPLCIITGVPRAFNSLATG